MNPEDLDDDVVTLLDNRSVSRLTHFTPARNLPNILLAGQILSTSDLVAKGLSHVTTDPERIDGRIEMICCSIELPNIYYFDKAKAKSNALNYHDWVVFSLDPRLAARKGALFSPGNAAAASGATLRSGADGLSRLYEPRVNGQVRNDRHRPASPTDMQAEVLIPGSIPLAEVSGIYLPSMNHVNQERGRLEQVGGQPSVFSWFSCPSLFDRDAVRQAVQQGSPLAVYPWKDQGTEDDIFEGKVHV